MLKLKLLKAHDLLEGLHILKTATWEFSSVIKKKKKKKKKIYIYIYIKSKWKNVRFSHIVYHIEYLWYKTQVEVVDMLDSILLCDTVSTLHFQWNTVLTFG